MTEQNPESRLSPKAQAAVPEIVKLLTDEAEARGRRRGGKTVSTGLLVACSILQTEIGQGWGED